MSMEVTDLTAHTSGREREGDSETKKRGRSVSMTFSKFVSSHNIDKITV